MGRRTVDGRGVLLVVGVQDEDAIQRPHGRAVVDLVVLGGHREHIAGSWTRVSDRSLRG